MKASIGPFLITVIFVGPVVLGFHVSLGEGRDRGWTDDSSCI